MEVVFFSSSHKTLPNVTDNKQSLVSVPDVVAVERAEYQMGRSECMSHCSLEKLISVVDEQGMGEIEVQVEEGQDGEKDDKGQR